MDPKFKGDLFIYLMIHSTFMPNIISPTHATDTDIRDLADWQKAGDL